MVLNTCQGKLQNKARVFVLSQQGPLRRIWSLGALGEGSGWDLRVRPQPPPSAASGNLGTWKSGIWGIWRSGDLGIQKFGAQTIQKIKDLKIQICSAQNVGKVWISRKKILPAPFGAIPCHFLHGPKKSKKCQIFCLFSLVDCLFSLVQCKRFVWLSSYA